MEKNEIVLFESTDGKVSLPVKIDTDTVWLTQAQIAQLFGKDRTVIGRHIRNAISEGDIVPETMCAKFAHLADNAAGSVKNEIYNLEVISEEEYERAKAVVIATNRASISHLQRQLHVGYNHAAKIIDLLEARGVIGPARGAGPREVLATE